MTLRTTLVVAMGMACCGAGCGGGDDEPPAFPSVGGGPGSGGATGATTASGGAVTTGGSAATGGAAAVGGEASLGGGGTGDQLVNVDGWVGGEPTVRDDDPAGIQGSWYLYGDGVTCAVVTGNPCTAEGCCLDWTTIVDSTYESWGCGIGMELNSSGGDTPTKLTYAGPAQGFTFTIEGASAPNPIRIGFTQSSVTDGIVSPFTEVTGPGTFEVRFSDAVCPSWATTKGCTPAVAASSYDLQIQIPGGDAAGSGRICVTSLTPIL